MEAQDSNLRTLIEEHHKHNILVRFSLSLFSSLLDTISLSPHLYIILIATRPIDIHVDFLRTMKSVKPFAKD
jgi:hypothetical protein